MNTNDCTCTHGQRVTADKHTNCALCNAFVSASDGHVAIKDSALGGMHQTFPHMVFQRLLEERTVLRLEKDQPLEPAYDRIRGMLVDWLSTMQEKLGLSERVLHVAVKYMDYILAHKDYPNSKYQLISLCSLMIAAKYDELDRNIPFPEDFTRQAKLPFRTNVLAECEMLLLKVLDWKLKVATGYEVVHCLLAQGVLFDDDRLIGSDIPPKEEHARLLTHVAEFLILSTLRGILAVIASPHRFQPDEVRCR